MHFWIDKRSQCIQGCGFSGRHIVPPSISGYGLNYRFRCGGFYPKPMVTPVHRFQSIEGIRIYNNRSAYQNRFPVINVQSPTHHNGSTSNVRNAQRSTEVLNSGQRGTPTPQRNIYSSTAKLKCIWVFFAVVTFLAGAKFYFYGVSIGMEVLTFCTLFVVILICGGAVSLCQFKAIASTGNESRHSTPHTTHNSEQNELDTANQVPNNDQQVLAEMPPPPYHIAVMLPNHDVETVQVIRDSPPPSYEKATV